MSRKAGFSLPAIAEQLPAFRTGRLGIGQMVEALQDRISEIDQQMRELHSLRAKLHAHIAWLQERFPQAAYNDVTGLCKLATRAEMQEQDWSLNPGRYVGVVIEEDGKTEEEFLVDLQQSLDELIDLDEAATALKKTVEVNLKSLIESV